MRPTTNGIYITVPPGVRASNIGNIKLGLLTPIEPNNNEGKLSKGKEHDAGFIQRSFPSG